MNTYKDFTKDKEDLQSEYLNKLNFYSELLNFISENKDNLKEIFQSNIIKLSITEKLKELIDILTIRINLFQDLYQKIRYSFFKIRDEKIYPYLKEKEYQKEIIKFGYEHNCEIWIKKARLLGRFDEVRRMEYELFMRDELRKNMEYLELICDFDKLVQRFRTYHIEKTNNYFVRAIQQ